jgi:hypothetical protein
MKGVTLERDTAISTVLTILILFIGVIIAYLILRNYYPQMSSDQLIWEKCLDWKSNGCTRESASAILIEVKKGNTKTLQQVCEERYGSRWLEECKNKCCP